MNENEAAWLTGARKALETGPAPLAGAGSGEIVVRVRAVGINPVDWMIQAAGRVMYPWLKAPAVLGSDVAGEVLAVGAEVTRFVPGDRILGLAIGTEKSVNSSAQGAFQRIVVLQERLTASIPDELSFEDAAVLPLGISTAACGLFQQRHLALQHPAANATPTEKTVLIWGGSTSVGSNAIQLAVAAGYDVVTTASPKNWDYVRSLGAREAFDYRGDHVVQDLVAALRGRTVAGALAIGEGSAARCSDVVQRCTGSRIVAIASAPVSFASLARGESALVQLPRILTRMVSSTALLQVRTRLRGVRTGFIWGSSLKDDEIGVAVFERFLPDALARRDYSAAPPARVVGHGLEAIQDGLQAQLAGTSAEKIVVSL